MPFLGSLRIGWKHRWNGSESGFLVNQQDIELFAYERLELRDWKTLVFRTNAAGNFESPLINPGAGRTRIYEATDKGGAKSSSRNARFEFVNPIFQKLAVQRIFRGLSQATGPFRINANSRLKRRRTID